MHGLLWSDNICKSGIWGSKRNLNIEKIIFKVVQMKLLAMHITNQKLSFDIFTVQISSRNMILISNDFWHKIKMYNFNPNNVLLSISTNIAVLLMTASVLQGHFYLLCTHRRQIKAVFNCNRKSLTQKRHFWHAINAIVMPLTSLDSCRECVLFMKSFCVSGYCDGRGAERPAGGLPGQTPGYPNQQIPGSSACDGKTGESLEKTQRKHRRDSIWGLASHSPSHHSTMLIVRFTQHL